jgi:hypothetical protein
MQRKGAIDYLEKVWGAGRECHPKKKCRSVAVLRKFTRTHFLFAGQTLFVRIVYYDMVP